MRLFVAVFPPPEAVADLTAAMARLRVGRAAAAGIAVRLCDPARAHLTLAFLGDVDAGRLADAESALGLAAETFRSRPGATAFPGQPAESIEGRPGGSIEGQPAESIEDRPGGSIEDRPGGSGGPPVLRLGGGGSFGRDRFTVLWVDVRGEVESLRVLARLVRSGLRRARLPHDEKPFRPHLTVARPGDRLDPADVAADRAALDGYSGPSWPATELVLIRSHQGPRPTYDRLAAWPL